MKKIAREFRGQPLVMISVSWDSNAIKWKDFINKNEMIWTQYRDANHRLSNAFGVEAIPHYFTIDSEGILTAETIGEGFDVEGRAAQATQPCLGTKAGPPALLIHASPFSIQPRNRPAKQVQRTTLVEPTFIEQGSGS